ncbi:MAG: nucleotidyltransferase family protein [Wenzhouxiangella sp.]|nr:nucleotidyltransferase family protein [Wenzhouxiangella sp.]
MGGMRRQGSDFEPEFFRIFRSIEDQQKRSAWLQAEGMLAAAPMLRARGLPLAADDPGEVSLEAERAAAEQQMLEALVRSGVPFLLAGPSLAAWTLYPEPGRRPRESMDLMIHARAVNDARAILRDEDFVPDPRGATRTESAQAWRRSKASVQLSIRLRWDFCDHPILNRRFSIAGLQAKSVVIEKPVAGLRALGVEHATLYSALRWVDAVHERFRLVDLFDQDLRWRMLGKEKLAELALLARQRGVAGILAEHLGMARRVFGTPVSTELLHSLKQSGNHERSGSLLGAGRGRMRYHLLGALYGRGLRVRGRHLFSLISPG